MNERNPQKLLIFPSANHLKGSLSKLGKTFGLGQELLKKQIDREEIYEDTSEEK